MSGAARPQHTLVFVGGLHRSGTTPLARALGAHPQISAFSGTGVKEDEGQHLQDVYPSARAYGGAGRFASAAGAHLTESSPLAISANAGRLFDAWSPYWDLTRPYLVEKSPPNLIMTRFLQALFPSSKLVILVRHPLVVALSTAKWAGPQTSLSRLVEHWLLAHETFLADAAHLHDVHALKYEELVTDPERTLEDIGRFLGLSGSIPGGSLQPGRSNTYRDQWQSLAQSRRPWRCRSVRQLRSRFAARVAAFGYDLDDFDAAQPFPRPAAVPGAASPS